MARHRRSSAILDLQSYIPPLLGAVIAGGIIGLEREWRGRSAGLRTHILVSLASALLMQAAVRQDRWAFGLLPDENLVTDPTRMAHGVLTGIGFLCAGVIFRTGFSIHGLTTAASLWITAAIGLLFGVGLYGLGVVGTTVTAVILVGLRLISKRVPALTTVDVDVLWRRQGPAPDEQVASALLAVDRKVRDVRFELIENGASVSRSWLLRTRDTAALKDLARRLDAIEGVTGFRLSPRAE